MPTKPRSAKVLPSFDLSNKAVGLQFRGGEISISDIQREIQRFSVNHGGSVPVVEFDGVRVVGKKLWWQFTRIHEYRSPRPWFIPRALWNKWHAPVKFFCGCLVRDVVVSVGNSTYNGDRFVGFNTVHRHYLSSSIF